MTEPGRLVRAYWDLERTVREPTAFGEALSRFLYLLHSSLLLGEQPLIFRVGGHPGERCPAFTVFVGYRGGATKVVAMNGHPDEWIVHNQAVMAASIVNFPPGFWADPNKGIMMLTHHLALATGKVWQRTLAQGPEIAAKWAFLALVLDDHTTWLGPIRRRDYVVTAQKVVNEALPARLLGIGGSDPVPKLAAKRCQAITQYAESLAPLAIDRSIDWGDLTPIPGRAVSQKLAHYFTRDEDGPRLSPQEAGALLGMDPRSIRRGATSYQKALQEQGQPLHLIISDRELPDIA